MVEEVPAKERRERATQFWVRARSLAFTLVMDLLFLLFSTSLIRCEIEFTATTYAQAHFESK